MSYDSSETPYAMTFTPQGRVAKPMCTGCLQDRDGCLCKAIEMAANQIFYSLGLGFGSLITFASYGKSDDDFKGNALKVAGINCATSVFAGFVVFPILGYLAQEMHEVNPCFDPSHLSDLSEIGLQGTGLAFIAFPIAISKMPFGFGWAMLFFLLLICLGIDSEFAMLESVMTVLDDLGMSKKLGLIKKDEKDLKPKMIMSAILCLVLFVFGLVFITRGGIYWFNLFDNYSCLTALFFVTGMECIGLMWSGKHEDHTASTFDHFKTTVENKTGINLAGYFQYSWKFVCPLLVITLLCFAMQSFDIMSASTSEPYPGGEGYLPSWSVHIGWFLAMMPVLVFFIGFCDTDFVTHMPHLHLTGTKEKLLAN